MSWWYWLEIIRSILTAAVTSYIHHVVVKDPLRLIKFERLRRSLIIVGVSNQSSDWFDIPHAGLDLIWHNKYSNSRIVETLSMNKSYNCLLLTCPFATNYRNADVDRIQSTEVVFDYWPSSQLKFDLIQCYVNCYGRELNHEIRISF